MDKERRERETEMRERAEEPTKPITWSADNTHRQHTTIHTHVHTYTHIKSIKLWFYFYV